MGDTVEVAIPVDRETAAALSDTRKREIVGRVIGRMLRRESAVDLLMDAIDRLKADAHARGLTDEIVEEELAAHRAERRR